MGIEVVGTVPVQNFTAVAGEALTKGAAVYLEELDEKLYYANAKTGAVGYDGGNAVPCIGFASLAAAAGATIAVITNGILEGFATANIEGAAVFTSGDEVYLGETDGMVTQTAPSDSGDVVQVLGRALSPTKMTVEIEAILAVA